MYFINPRFKQIYRVFYHSSLYYILKESMNNTQMISISSAANKTLIFICILLESVLDSIKFDRRKAVTIGLYNSIVIAAFSPPLIKLNGKNAGINNSTMEERD